MKGLGSIFQNFFEFLIFINFSMFYTYLNIAQIRIFEKVEKTKIWSIFELSYRSQNWFFFKNLFFIFFLSTKLKDSWNGFLFNGLQLKLKFRNWDEIFRFPDFGPKSYIKSLRKNPKKSKFSKMSYDKICFYRNVPLVILNRNKNTLLSENQFPSI